MLFTVFDATKLSTAFAQGTAFTYQGRLNAGGSPANGSFDLAFSLFATNTSGVAIAGPVTNSAVSVTNGLFTTTVDFGNVFTGASNWLQIAVSTNAANAFTTLIPRQQLTPVPYAEFASGVSGLMIQQNTNGAPNVIGGASVNFVSNRVVGATIAGGGAINYHGSSFINKVTDDFGTVGGGINNTASAGIATVSGGNFNTASGSVATVGGGADNIASGTDATVGGGADNLASGIEATVGGGFQNTASGTEATVGGGNFNSASGQNATVGGGNVNIAGGSWATVGGGNFNTASFPAATVSGGQYNTASNYNATVGGGSTNTASGNMATVGGGGQNTASGNSATVGGGFNNNASFPAATVGGGDINTASGDFATVGGGDNNTASGPSATVGGGAGNTASGQNATVGGGNNNTASGFSATVGGGNANAASGQVATVAGGLNNTAGGDYSFAAGQQAQALHQGSFVWADSQNALFASTANDQFNIRAQGGLRLNTDTSLFFGSQIRQMLNLWSTQYGIGVQSFTEYFRTDVGGTFSWFMGGVHTNVQNDPGGGTELMRLAANALTSNVGINVNSANGYDQSSLGSFSIDSAGVAGGRFRVQVNGDVGIGNNNPTHLFVVGSAVSPAYCDGITWQNSSDRNAKEGFATINPCDVLEKVATLPITQWKYKVESDGTRHVGPMAQDFHAAFGLNGADDTHISTVDEGGVALAAIQGLNEKLESGKRKAESQIEELTAENAELKARLERLEQIILNQKSN